MAQELGAWNATIEWNWGADFPEAYDIASRLMDATETGAAWDIAAEYFEYIHENYLAFSTIVYAEPFAIGPRVGSVDMNQKWRSIPELESWKPALD